MSTKDQKIKEFLQTKRAPLDEWNTHEQLCLASAVACSGDQNWMSVSRALKGIVSSYSTRPADWFISKSCATQYGKLLESVETPKRKKRTASERDQATESPSTPVESLVKKLTAERITELKNAIYEEQQHYMKLKDEILFLQSPSIDETKIKDIWNQLEQEKIQQEMEEIRHNQWLKEREEKKLQHERQWRGPYKAINIRTQKSQDDIIEPDTTTQPSGTSPLLTSLLKSPSQTTVPTISHNSVRVAPTITNLLTGTSMASDSPIFITQNPSSSSTFAHQNININTSTLVNLVQNIKTDTSASSHSVVSQSAPTLITLLDKKCCTSLSQLPSDTSNANNQQIHLSVERGGKESEVGKDEEAELLADFNELIDAEKFDIDEDLEDLNSIIMNPEILEEKISNNEPIKDADDSSQATYEKLKIKQIVETIQDLACVSEVETSQNSILANTLNIQESVIGVSIEHNEKIYSEHEHSSVEIIEAPMESNDSIEITQKNTDEKEERILLISDESSNANDDKKLHKSAGKTEANDKECQSIKDILNDDDSYKESQKFPGISMPESDENSISSEKETKEPNCFLLDDSEETIFRENKERHSEIDKQAEENTIVKESPVETSLEEQFITTGFKPASSTEIEEASRSAIDSDEEVLEVKASRLTGRRKGNDLRSDSTTLLTRSRDHSENDDHRGSTPIRTRSRHSSTAVSTSESKSTFTFSKEQDHSMWKARWDDCVKELQKLKEYHHIVDNKIIQDEIYKKVCLHPMNMKIIAKNIESNLSTLPNDIKRDFVLMCTNIMMFSNKGKNFNEMVNQFANDGIEIIEAQMDVDDIYKKYRRHIKKKI